VAIATLKSSASLATEHPSCYVRFIAKLNSKGAAAMSDDLNVLFGYQVQSTAEWRRRKAEEFPDDARNLVAAEELERLAAQIDRLEGSEIHEQLREAQDCIIALCTANKDNNVFDWSDISETVSAELRSIGFHATYRDGAKLLEWYRDLLREKLHDLLDQVVPAPDLDEQVADDPAVKAAKQAYDDAYAKAYAEARKRL
jgi:homoserine dehydrogenase